jgi:hypothetical protein
MNKSRQQCWALAVVGLGPLKSQLMFGYKQALSKEGNKNSVLSFLIPLQYESTFS